MASTKRITRRREIKSCKYCYVHKIKCDKKIPCSKCTASGNSASCEYGFEKEDIIPVENGSDGSVVTKKRSQKVRTSNKNKILFRPKYYNPFFNNIINANLLSLTPNEQIADEHNFQRNIIVQFDKFQQYDIDMEDILNLLPVKISIAKSKMLHYFDVIHPIIPIVSRDQLSKIINETYKCISDKKEANASNLLLLMAVFFCESYADICSKNKRNLSYCNKYFQSVRFLLDLIQVPLSSSIESIQAYLLVNFVLDPNMVHATGYSAMLVRLAQQNGIYNIAMEMSSGNEHIKILWNFLLYLEGSASVAFGLPFFCTSQLLDAAPLTMSDFKKNVYPYPIEYSYGRFIINRVFKDLMRLTTLDSIPKQEFDRIKRQIDILYHEINFLNLKIRSTYSLHPEYFTSTLFIFVYRLHLRYMALNTLQTKRDEIIEPLEKQPLPLDIPHMLQAEETFSPDVITLSLLLLLHTMKRLIQKDIGKYLWYTRGSTVMQYLFIILKDIYQNPEKPFVLSEFPAITQEIMDQDIKVIIETNPIIFKFALVEDLIKLLEEQLISLWNDDEIYKFIIVKSVKETVWEKHQAVKDRYSQDLKNIRKCNMFAACNNQLHLSSSSTFTGVLDKFKDSVNTSNMFKVVQDWTVEYKDS